MLSLTAVKNQLLVNDKKHLTMKLRFLLANGVKRTAMVSILMVLCCVGAQAKYYGFKIGGEAVPFFNSMTIL